MLLLGFLHGPAAAQGRLEASYRATLSGLAIGSGSMVFDFAGDHYTLAASGQAAGLMKLFASGTGDAAVTGAIQGGKLLPASYSVTIRTRDKVNQVRMALVAGMVKALAVEPPIKPDADRAPLAEAHKRGVIDPISAGIMPGAGADGLAPEVCDRKAPVFDGRIRFDLTLSYKRTEKVKTDRGYQGPAVVCRVMFNPVGGHEKDKYAIKYLRENRDMELWFAPVAGTSFVAIYRISVPTPLGPGVLQATRFIAGATAVTGARTQ